MNDKANDKVVYGIAQLALVMPKDDADGLDNEEEPVICIPLGVHTVHSKAVKVCKECNKNGKSSGIKFVVRTLKVRD